MNTRGLKPITQTYPLTITRKRRLYGAFRPLRIYVKVPRQRQAIRLGVVKQGQSITIDVPQDAKQIFSKVDWFKTEPMDLSSVSAGDRIYANAWVSLNPLRLVGTPTLPIEMETAPK